MKRFADFLRNWFPSVLLTFGTLLLYYVTFAVWRSADFNIIMLAVPFVYYAYGYILRDDIIPFFKHLSARRREKRNKEVSV